MQFYCLSLNWAPAQIQLFCLIFLSFLYSSAKRIKAHLSANWPVTSQSLIFFIINFYQDANVSSSQWRCGHVYGLLYRPLDEKLSKFPGPNTWCPIKKNLLIYFSFFHEMIKTGKCWSTMDFITWFCLDGISISFKIRQYDSRMCGFNRSWWKETGIKKIISIFCFIFVSETNRQWQFWLAVSL